LPLLLYGFSGGAHFVSGFEEYLPQRVFCWCAYSAEWWDMPAPTTKNPPGLIVCGEKDVRLGPSLEYFKQGRALAKPWLWLCVPNSGHEVCPPVESFVRHYFTSILSSRNQAGVWVDIDQKIPATSVLVSKAPSVTGWIPDNNLFGEWAAIHQP
jgi:hypothetical protein